MTNESSLPLGIKLIWINQALSLSAIILAALEKSSPIAVGPWVMPHLISNIYLATMIVSHAAIVWDLLKLKRTAFNLLIFVESLSLCVLFANLFITKEILDKFNTNAHIAFTMDMYRLIIVPAILLQLLILLYIYKKRRLFVN